VISTALIIICANSNKVYLEIVKLLTISKTVDMLAVSSVTTGDEVISSVSSSNIITSSRLEFLEFSVT